MDLEEDLKFAFDCEVNKNLRRTDAIRSSLFQLVALRSRIPLQVYLERQRDLLEEYSFQVDKEDDTNSFINSALMFARESPRPCLADKWQSVMKKRLEDNMDPVEMISMLNNNFTQIVNHSQVFRKHFKSRLACDPSQSEKSDNRKATFQLKPACSPKLGSQVRNSPTRVSGLFRSSSKASRSLFSSDSDNGGDSQKDTTNEVEPSSTLDSETLKENRKKSFMTGLEKHLADQVLNDGMNPTDARQIIEDVRKNSSTFKNPAKKSESKLADDERLKGIEKPMIELIQSEIVTNLENTDWSHIAGLEYAKSKIQQIAILPLLRPDLFTGIRSPPKGILLFGPPGTGKTMLGRCIASQAHATFFSITSSTLTSKWIGDGEKAMKTLFSVARSLKPSVIFIDEVDSLLKSRSDSEHESSRRMKTEFLAQFDGLSNQINDGLLVVGTTNRPQELDEAVRRRFAAKLYIPLPEHCARQQIIKNNLKNEKHSLSEEEIASIADKTEGYSGSDMKHLCSEAAMYSFKEVMERLNDLNKSDIREINQEDFILALNQVKPSFTTDDLCEYESWNKKFGSNL